MLLICFAAIIVLATGDVSNGNQQPLDPQEDPYPEEATTTRPTEDSYSSTMATTIGSTDDSHSTEATTNGSTDDPYPTETTTNGSTFDSYSPTVATTIRSTNDSYSPTVATTIGSTDDSYSPTAVTTIGSTNDSYSPTMATTTGSTNDSYSPTVATTIGFTNETYTPTMTTNFGSTDDPYNCTTNQGLFTPDFQNMRNATLDDPCFEGSQSWLELMANPSKLKNTVLQFCKADLPVNKQYYLSRWALAVHKYVEKHSDQPLHYIGLCPCPCAETCKHSTYFYNEVNCGKAKVTQYYLVPVPKTTTTTATTPKTTTTAVTTKTITSEVDIAENCSKYGIYTPPVVNITNLKCFEFNNSWLDSLSDVSTRNKALQICDGNINCWTYNNLMEAAKLRNRYTILRVFSYYDLCPCNDITKCEGFKHRECTLDFKHKVWLAQKNVSRESFNVTLPEECKENEPLSSELSEQTCYNYNEHFPLAISADKISGFCAGGVNCWVYKDWMESIYIQKLADTSMTRTYHGFCPCKNASICENPNFFNETPCSPEYRLKIAEALEKLSYTSTEPPHSATTQITITKVTNVTTTTQKNSTYVPRTEASTEAEEHRRTSTHHTGVLNTSTVIPSEATESRISASLGTTVTGESISNTSAETAVTIGESSVSTSLGTIVTGKSTGSTSLGTTDTGKTNDSTFLENTVTTGKNTGGAFLGTTIIIASRSEASNDSESEVVQSTMTQKSEQMMTTNSIQSFSATDESAASEVSHTSCTSVAPKEETSNTSSCFHGPENTDTGSTPLMQATASSKESSRNCTEESSSQPLLTATSSSISSHAQISNTSTFQGRRRSFAINQVNHSTTTSKVSEERRDFTISSTDSHVNTKARNTVVAVTSHKSSLDTIRRVDLIATATHFDDYSVYSSTRNTIGTSDISSSSTDSNLTATQLGDHTIDNSTTTTAGISNKSSSLQETLSDTSSRSRPAEFSSSNVSTTSTSSDITQEGTLEVSKVSTMLTTQGELSPELFGQTPSRDAKPATSATVFGSFDRHSTKDLTAYSTSRFLTLPEILGYPSIAQNIPTTIARTRSASRSANLEESTSTQKIFPNSHITLSEILTVRNGYSTPIRPAFTRKSPNTDLTLSEILTGRNGYSTPIRAESTYRVLPYTRLTLSEILTGSPITATSSLNNLVSKETTSYSKSNWKSETSVEEYMRLEASSKPITISAHPTVAARTGTESVIPGKVLTFSRNTDKSKPSAISFSSLSKKAATSKQKTIITFDSSADNNRTQSTPKKTTSAHWTSNNESYKHAQTAMSSKKLPRVATSSPLKSSVYNVSEVEAKNGGMEYGPDAYTRSASSTSKTPFRSMKDKSATKTDASSLIVSSISKQSHLSQLTQRLASSLPIDDTRTKRLPTTLTSTVLKASLRAKSREALASQYTLDSQHITSMTTKRKVEHLTASGGALSSESTLGSPHFSPSTTKREVKYSNSNDTITSSTFIPYSFTASSSWQNIWRTSASEITNATLSLAKFFDLHKDTLTSSHSSYPNSKYIIAIDNTTQSEGYGTWTGLPTIWNMVDDFFSPSSASSNERSKRASDDSISVQTNYRKSSKIVTLATISPRFPYGAKDPCPTDYIEYFGYCYLTLPPKDTTTYKRALATCSRAGANLADESVLKNLNLLKFLNQSSNQGKSASATLYYVNEYDSEMIQRDGIVRIISTEGSTRFFLAVERTAKVNERLVNVLGLCRKRAEDNTECNLSDLEFYELSQYLEFPKDRMKVPVGGTISIACVNNNVTVELTCTEQGAWQPYPPTINCTQKPDEDVIRKETPKYRVVQSSCLHCYSMGTESCEELEGGISCRCKLGWTGFTCWNSPDQCALAQLQCGPNGKCVSDVDRAYCECTELYDGKQCEHSKLSLSYFFNENTVVNGPAAASLVLSTGDFIVMIAKAALKMYRPKKGEDTQVFYQNMRSLSTSIGGLAVLFFHHPGIFNISPASCNLWFVVSTCCFSLGFCFFTLEALNVFQVILSERKNVWGNALVTTILPIQGISDNTLIAAFTTGSVLMLAAATQHSKVATLWTCLGHFTVQTMNVLLPVILFNILLAIASNIFAYTGWIVFKHMPQYRQKMSSVLRDKRLDEKNHTTKCYRNVVFVAVGPWLLFGSWLTTALSSDWTIYRPINILAFIFSMLYTSCNLLQSAFTSPNMYSTQIQYAMRFLPRKIAPARDAVTLWEKSEVLQRSKQRNAIQANQMQRGYPWPPSSPDYLPFIIRSQLRNKWTREYAKIKVRRDCARLEALYEVHATFVIGEFAMCKEEVRMQLSFLFMQWMAKTYRKDLQPDSRPSNLRVTQLQQLLTHHYNVRNSLKVLRLTRMKQDIMENPFLRALEDYLKMFESDPPQFCRLVVPNAYGNTIRVKFSKTRIPMIEEVPNLEAISWNEQNEGNRWLERLFMLLF